MAMVWYQVCLKRAEKGDESLCVGNLQRLPERVKVFLPAW
jgi:hypothetical protein